MKTSEIKFQESAGQRSSDFLDRCTACGVCTGVCSFLETVGRPDEIIARGDARVFLCTNCGACSSVCPSDLDPAAALLAGKHKEILSQDIPVNVSKALRSARNFVRWGSSFPFSFHSRSMTVFWPGCSLAGMAPDTVLGTRRLLAKSLGEEVGLALDCCADPAYELGDLQTASQRVFQISRTFGEKGISRVIAACANCVKIMRDKLPGVQVQHVLEVLPDALEARLPSDSGIYLHHPCPSFSFDSIQQGARRICGNRELVEQTRPRCCGQGGGLPALSPSSADACTQRVFDAAKNALLVTYCMGCKEQFLRNGRQAYHLLELIIPSTAVSAPVSSVKKWMNRLGLAMKARGRSLASRSDSMQSPHVGV